MPDYPPAIIRYGTDYNQYIKNRNEYLDKVKKITVTYYIKIYKNIIDVCTKIIKTNDYNNLKIFIDFYIAKQTENKTKIMDLFNACKNGLDILNSTKEKYLYKVLLNNIKSACINKDSNKDFDALMSSTFLWKFKKIKYKNTIIENKYIDLYNDFERIRWVFYKIML